MMKEIWLDLEQTIISSWDDPILCNVEKIRNFLINTKSVNIFSFAVWNEKDRKHFRNNLAPWLSRELNVQFNRCPSIEQIINDIFWKIKNIKIDQVSLVNEWGKARVFEEFIRVTGGSGEFVLIDDVVEDTSITRTLFNGNIQHIQLINVDNLV